MREPDFRLLFEAVPGACLVLLPDLSIVAASDAYLRVTMTSRADIVGRALFDVFPPDPSDPDASGVTSVSAVLRRVIHEKRPQTLPVLRYAIRRPPAGVFEERFWKPSYVPVLDDEGQVEYILHQAEDVTEVVRLQRDKVDRDRHLGAVTAESERLTQLLDSAPDATVIIDERARIQLVNVQTERLFGYAREELLGQPLEVLIPERFRASHAKHMIRYFANPGSRSMGSGLELYGRRKDASEVPIEVSLSPQRGASTLTVSAAIRDISERKRLEAAARITADRLASAVDSIQDAFALFDADDRLILCNSVFRRLLHESVSGALVGKSYRELLEAWLEDMDFPDIEARRRFGAERLENRRREQTASFDIRMRDGRKLRVIDRRTPEGGLVKTVWDLTDDERLAEELRRAQLAAEAANTAKSEFLSSMSHELRTPLNAILGFAQLLRLDKKEPLSDRHKERVTQILRGGEHLLRLIDDVLDLARIEAGRVSISVEPVHVPDVLQEVLRTLEPMAARQGLELMVESASEVPLVKVDRTRFAQILMNFGSNAIKYNRASGEVRFVVSEADSARLRISVTDTGLGIPLDKQDKLFQPFQRAGQETGPIEGTGIGLVITKQLAELMGGAVGFQSTEKVGSTFWVEVPVHGEPARAPTNLSGQSAPVPPLAATGTRTVLYVEDNPANVMFMKDLMSSFESIELLTAPNAEIGVDVARDRRPEVIIMDINLPGMSGVDALRVLRGLSETRDIPVIALTAAATERDKQLGLQAGFFRYLTKPVKVEELLLALEQLLAD